MSVALKLLIEKTEAAIAAATDPKKKLRLQRDLASFQLTAMRAEGGDDDGEDDDEDDDEDSKAKKAAAAEKKAKKAALAARHRAKAAEYKRKMEESEEDAKAAEDDDEEDESEEANAARVARAARLEIPIAGMTPGAAAALASQAGQDAAVRARLDVIERERSAERKQASIDAALHGHAYGDQAATKGPRITPGDAKMLASKDAGFVRDFLSMRTKAIVNTDETHLQQPTMLENADLPAADIAQIDAMVAKLPNLSDAQRADVKRNMIAGRRAVAAGANGAPGRY